LGGALADGSTSEAAARELAELTARVKAHRAEKDLGGLKGDLKATVALHARNADDKKLRKKALALIDSVPRGMKNDDLRKDMLNALGQTRDAGASKYIKLYLKQKNLKQADDVLLTAIRVAGEAPDGNRYPKLAGYLGNMLERPSIKELLDEEAAQFSTAA